MHAMRIQVLFLPTWHSKYKTLQHFKSSDADKKRLFSSPSLKIQKSHLNII